MKRIIALLVTFIALLVVIPFTGASAYDIPDELFESYTAGGDGDSQDIAADNFTSMQFTTDNNSHTVDIIKLIIKKVGSPGTITVSIKEADGAHKPTGNDLCSGTLSDNVVSTAYALEAFDVDDVTLEGNTEYNIVLRAETGGASDYVVWRMDTGGGLAGALGYESTDGGITWAADGTADYLFELWGIPTISLGNAAVFSGVFEGNDTLFCFEYTNFYEPYYPNANPSDYFKIQLMNTAGTVILHSNAMVDWGLRPGSIYLSADMSAAITQGAAYYIRIYGYAIDGTPTESLQLTTSNWYGNNLGALDAWCRGVAADMKDYYGIDFVEYSADKGGLVLNQEGGEIFNHTINGLKDARPSLFLYANEDIGITSPTAVTNSFDAAGTYRTVLGDNIADMLDAGGGWIATDGQTFGAILLFVAWAIFAIVVVAITSRQGATEIGFGAACALGMPFIIAGGYVHLLSIYVVIITLILAAAGIAWGLFWSRA